MEATDLFDFNMIWNFLTGTLFQLVLFGACVYYIIRKQTVDAFLLAGGSFIHVLTSIFYSVVLPVLARSSGMMIYSNRYLMLTIGAISIIGSILFAIGFIILIINHVGFYQKVYDQQ